VDDVAERSVRAELMKVVAALDYVSDDLEGELLGVVTYDLFDPLRIVMADIRHAV
jgi:hypothetical protein